MPEYYKRMIPADRLVTIHDHENHAELKLKIRQDGAWNTALALASANSTELKLIKVMQAEYPLHLVEEIANPILVELKNHSAIVIPGKMKASFRPTYIGPAYSRCTMWSPIPLL